MGATFSVRISRYGFFNKTLAAKTQVINQRFLNFK